MIAVPLARARPAEVLLCLQEDALGGQSWLAALRDEEASNNYSLDVSNWGIWDQYTFSGIGVKRRFVLRTAVLLYCKTSRQAACCVSITWHGQ